MSQATIRELFVGASIVQLVPGQAIFHQGDPVTRAYWLEAGRARLTRASERGQVATLHNAHAQCWFAEASLFADHYHCDAHAVTDVTLWVRPRDQFVGALTQGVDRSMAAMADLARELRDARARAELLSLKTVTERLDAWHLHFGDKPPGLTWAAIAGEIGVTPEALYRELARRRSGTRPRAPVSRC